METYHKIQTLFKRHLDGPKKGKMIHGAWTTPELEYLAGNQWEFTEKVDGTNIRIGWRTSGVRPSFAGRTDKAVIPVPLLEYLEETFTHELFRKAFDYESVGSEVVLFGEGVGPKIQSGSKYIPWLIFEENAMHKDKTEVEQLHEHEFILFDVKIGDWWLARKDVDDIASKLGIKSVPTIGHGTLQDGIDIVSSGITFTDTGAMVRWGSGGLQSAWGNFEAEGIVARPVVPLFDRKGQRIITKIKAVDFR